MPKSTQNSLQNASKRDATLVVALASIIAGMASLSLSAGVDMPSGGSDFEYGEAIGEAIGNAVAVAVFIAVAAYLLVLRKHTKRARLIAVAVILIAASLGSILGLFIELPHLRLAADIRILSMSCATLGQPVPLDQLAKEGGK